MSLQGVMHRCWVPESRFELFVLGSAWQYLDKENRTMLQLTDSALCYNIRNNSLFTVN